MSAPTRAARIASWLAALVLGLALAACAPAPAPATTEDAAMRAQPLTVFAAASLKESLDAVVAAYQRRSGQPVQVSYAASSALARQIEQRAPADVFMSADSDWMDWLQARDLVDRASREDLLGNELVLVAPADSKATPLNLEPGTDLRPLLGRDGRLALALTASVPAGKYARAAFESMGTWDALQPRVAEAENVRAALLQVARGEAPLGVVYASDAKAEPKVKVLATFPHDSHPAIVYPVARILTSTHPAALEFLDWLHSPEASAIFREHGFSLL